MLCFWKCQGVPCRRLLRLFFNNPDKKVGFTLIELIVVIAVVAIIASLTIVGLNNMRVKGRDTRRISDIRQVQAALEIYKNDNDVYPSAITSGNALVGPDGTIYMNKVPTSPNVLDGSCTSDSYTYQSANTSATYSLSYCLGGQVNIMAAGNYIAVPGNIGSPGASGGGSSFTCGDTVAYEGGPYNATGTSTSTTGYYRTVLIGTQCWLKDNLNVGTMITGTATSTDNAVIEKYCYNNNTANCTTDGGLYQWDEAMQYAASCNGTGEGYEACATPVQGICPTGWHIPSHYEYVALARAVCTSGTCATDFPYDQSSTGWRGTNEGTKLKVGGSSGFEGLLAGYRDTNGSFANRGTNALVWSSLEGGVGAWRRNLNSGYASVDQYTGSKLYGWSVRCLKD